LGSKHRTCEIQQESKEKGASDGAPSEEEVLEKERKAETEKELCTGGRGESRE